MRRRAILFLLVGTALPLAVASTAWACGVLSTLTINTPTASPNQTVTAFGRNYRSGPGNSAVQIHLATRSGTVIASTTPTASRTINTSFQIPASTSPGWYVLLATQYDAKGVPIAGTPGRTTLRIQGSARAARAHHAAALSPWSSTPTGPAGSTAPVARIDSGSSGPGLLTLLAVVMSLTLLAGGLTLASRRSPTARRPPLGI